MAKVTRADLKDCDGYRLVADLRFGIFRCAKWWECCIEHPNGEWLFARTYCRLKDAKESLDSADERRKLLMKTTRGFF